MAPRRPGDVERDDHDGRRDRIAYRAEQPAQRSVEQHAVSAHASVVDERCPGDVLDRPRVHAHCHDTIVSPVRRSALLWTLLLAPAASRAAAQQLEAPLVTSVAGRRGARARALPRTIQVFVVAVPVLFRAGEPVTYTVTPTGGATIIPPLQGMAEAAAGARTVLVATSVPAAALAGERTIAEVQL